jgi:hypothetical protein
MLRYSYLSDEVNVLIQLHFPFSLFKLGDKYGADTAIQIFVFLLRPYIAQHPATVFALGAVYDRTDILIEALQHFGDKMTERTSAQEIYDEVYRNYRTVSKDSYASNAGCVSLKTVPWELRQRIPLKIMWKLDALKESILVDQKGTWATLSSQIDWKVRSLSLRCG